MRNEAYPLLSHRKSFVRGKEDCARYVARDDVLYDAGVRAVRYDDGDTGGYTSFAACIFVDIPPVLNSLVVLLA